MLFRSPAKNSALLANYNLYDCWLLRNGVLQATGSESVVPVADIPRTKSGRITALAVRNVIHGQPVKNTEALANPEALDDCRDIEELST